MAHSCRPCDRRAPSDLPCSSVHSGLRRCEGSRRRGRTATAVRSRRSRTSRRSTCPPSSPGRCHRSRRARRATGCGPPCRTRGAPACVQPPIGMCRTTRRRRGAPRCDARLCRAGLVELRERDHARGAAGVDAFESQVGDRSADLDRVVRLGVRAVHALAVDAELPRAAVGGSSVRDGRCRARFRRVRRTARGEPERGDEKRHGEAVAHAHHGPPG